MKHFFTYFLVGFLAIQGKGQINTPNGVQVLPAALFTYLDAWPNTNAQLQSFQNDIQNGFYGPSCVVLNDYTRQYNCHGYAWHVSTGGNKIGIDQVTHGGVTLTLQESTQAILKQITTERPESCASGILATTRRSLLTTLGNLFQNGGLVRSSSTMVTMSRPVMEYPHLIGRANMHRR